MPPTLKAMGASERARTVPGSEMVRPEAGAAGSTQTVRTGFSASASTAASGWQAATKAASATTATIRTGGARREVAGKRLISSLLQSEVGSRTVARTTAQARTEP